uniref:BHLH domain-containing protein n=1 Tax=Denticeps clupeoides TaxID=299321 RepID=A0AAY4BMM4_9TELE
MPASHPPIPQASKPLMERRRRARINACLVELRALLLRVHGAQAQRPRLEKAEVLELTVRHLRSLSSRGAPPCACTLPVWRPW